MRYYSSADEAYDHEIAPVLGDYADSFDLDGLCEVMLDYDPGRGWFAYEWDMDTFNDLLFKYDNYYYGDEPEAVLQGIKLA